MKTDDKNREKASAGTKRTALRERQSGVVRGEVGSSTVRIQGETTEKSGQGDTLAGFPPELIAILSQMQTQVSQMQTEIERLGRENSQLKQRVSKLESMEQLRMNIGMQYMQSVQGFEEQSVQSFEEQSQTQAEGAFSQPHYTHTERSAGHQSTTEITDEEVRERMRAEQCKKALPKCYTSGKAALFWEKLIEHNYVDTNYQTLVSRAQAGQIAYLLSMLNPRMGDRTDWKTFERLWNKRNLRNDWENIKESDGKKIKKLYDEAIEEYESRREE